MINTIKEQNIQKLAKDGLIAAFLSVYHSYDNNNQPPEIKDAYPVLKQASDTWSPEQHTDAFRMVDILMKNSFSPTQSGLSAALLHADNCIRGIV